MKSLFRRALAALAATIAIPAAAGQYTDLWFNPQQSGWGVNVVQQLETAFVTLFTYGPDGKPTWYFASDARVTAYAGALPLFSGTLYRSEGSWHGGPFDPTRFKSVAVGTIDLELLGKSSMRVHTLIDGVRDTREVVRQTWDQELLAGNYISQAVLRLTTPTGQLIGTRDFAADVLVSFLQAEGFMRTDLHAGGGRCEYRGPYQQSGKLLSFSGTFTCDAGDARAGTFEMRDIEVTENGFTAQLRTTSDNVLQNGRVGAVRR
jgi:hypothetical protein